MNRTVLLAALAMVGVSVSAAHRPPTVMSEVDAVYPHADSLYIYLHQHPELSAHEEQTAAKIASELQALGYEVTTHVGGTGVVGVLKNGSGPTALLRTELDALPVTENTGLPFASTVRTKDATGADVGVAHACGHDAHMAAFVSTARIMADTRNTWHGTLVLIAQPAEEIGTGAKAMIADGLLTRFPRPDYAFAVHDDARIPAGTIAYHAGPLLGNASSVNITIFGRGGHGARPESTVDPIVIAARFVVALQTIVSRENSPFDPAVITVGSIHGGTKNNVIPDEVKLQLTVRSFTPAVHQRLLDAITRIANAESVAGQSPREPAIEVLGVATALVNDTALTDRVKQALLRDVGADMVQPGDPEMVSEDFAEFPRAGIPSLMLRIGAVEKSKFDAAAKSGTQLPSLHSSTFYPDRVPTIKSAIASEVVALRSVLGKGARSK